MKAAPAKKLSSMVGTAALVSVPASCQAATAMLPWDYTLFALQDMLLHTIAPWAVGCAFAGSVVLYAIGAHDKQAGRLFGSGIGGCVALAVVHLLNYIAL